MSGPRRGGPSPAPVGTARLRRGGETVKCVSVVQPWATLVVLGAKRYLAWDWTTSYRGTLAIHASGHFPEFARGLCREEPFRSILREAALRSWSDLPTSALIGTVRLADCRPSAKVRRRLLEEDLGDYRPGRWLWQLADPRPLRRPLRMSGRLGIFDIPVQYLS